MATLDELTARRAKAQAIVDNAADRVQFADNRSVSYDLEQARQTIRECDAQIATLQGSRPRNLTLSPSSGIEC